MATTTPTRREMNNSIAPIMGGCRKFRWFASTTEGEPITGITEIYPGGVTDELRILNVAWQRSAVVAAGCGADTRRLVKLVAGND